MNNVKLNTIPEDYGPIIHASQYDKGRKIRLNLLEDKTPYTLDGTEVLSISVKKPDNKLVSMDVANVFEGKSYVDFFTTEQMCAVVGDAVGELTISKDGTSIGTCNFVLAVEPSPEAGPFSESEIDNLDRRIDDHIDEVLPGMVEAYYPQIDQRVDDDVSEAMGNYYTKAQTDEIASEKANTTYVENKFATQFDNMIGDAGRFKPSSSWYATAGASGYSVSDSVATFTASAQYGGIKAAQAISVVSGHKYYSFAKIKSDSKICLSYDGTAPVFTTGSGEWEFVSVIRTETTTRNRSLTVSNNNTTGFGSVEVKEVGVIDLTLAYGENVPAKADIDAKIEPMGALSMSTAGRIASELVPEVDSLNTRVTTLENNVDTRSFKMIALGDSITAFGTGSRGWIRYFKERLNVELIANTAVDGAWLHDKAAATVYDGNPQPGDNNLNVLGNQVQKILNNNYEAPDLIMIAVGTNSGINITEQNMKDVYFYNYQFVDLDSVDRTTDAGAYRWCLEKLHTKYPDAIIIWCSPIHGAEPTMKSATSILAWGESLRIATAMTGQQFIESYRCGINGWKEVMNSEGEYLQDGLHPNAKGAKKLGYYNASQVKNILMQVFGT